MTQLPGGFSRRDFLRLGAATGLAAAAGPSLAACGGPAAESGSGNDKFNWLTWPNHFESAQVRAASKELGFTLNPVLFEDNALGYQKVRGAGSDFQSSSADGLWAHKYLKDGLIDPFDITSIKAAADLYPIAREYPFWTTPDGYLSYPNAWSMSILFYNPKHVKQAPDSWHALLKPEYRGKIVIPNSGTAILANAGVAIGAKNPMDMSTEELSRAKAYLSELKPNILKLASQDSDVIRALADESAWIGVQWLGTEFRVKNAGGPVVKGIVPKEGTTGWIDGEMSVRNTGDPKRFEAFLNAMKTPENDADLFLKNGNPYLNEKAYKLLVDKGKKDLADLALFNHPDKVMDMQLWGPSSNDQAYTDAFNEVFGA